MRYVIVGTAGHIDHGKTALVRSLTGVDTDRFKEEKERGITIDIGFANLSLNNGTRIGFVDVPGHERFVKNMLAGIGGIDLVMLVVAADESVMPQTREHLEICSLLRVRHGLTVISKVDTVDSDLADLVELEVREYLQGTFLSDAPILRFSAVTGEGREQLIETLGETASRVETRDSSEAFRLPVDRCFTMKGFGTVVTGTLVSGTIAKDDPVEVLPSGLQTRIRGVQVHGRFQDRAEAGQRTALNLQGVDVHQIQRGMVLAVPGMFEPAAVIDCHLELLPSAPGPIRRRKRIRFHTGTAEIIGYARLLGIDRLDPGEAGFAQIRLEEQTVAVPGDRFIIRQYSPMTTIGGGEVLEVRTPKHRIKDRAVIERLERLRTASVPERLLLMAEEAGLRTIGLKDCVSQIGLGPDTLRSHLETLQREGRIRFLSGNPLVVVSEQTFQSARKAVLAAVETFHSENPLEGGISREALQSRALQTASSIVFQAVLDALVQDQKLETSHEIVHLHGRRVRLNAEEERMQETIQAAFRSHGLEVPPAAEVLRKLHLPSATAKKLLQFMIRERSLAKINEELVIDQRVLDEVVAKLKARKKTDARLGVPQFKDLTGVSRKYAIPILEYFDRIRVTRRDGNNRTIL